MKTKADLPNRWTEEAVFSDPSFALSIRFDNMLSPLDFHSHDFCELVFVLKGKGFHHLRKIGIEGENKFEINAGDLFSVDTTVEHRYTNKENLSIINILFQPSLFKDEQAVLANVNGLFEFLVVEPMFRSETNFGQKLNLSSSVRSDIHKQIMQLHDELNAKRSGWQSAARAIFILLLVKIGRTYTDSLNASGQEVEMAGKKGAVENAVAYMKENFANIKSLNSIADNVFLSPNYFCQIFKTSVGVSPWDFLTRIRLEEAKLLLETTDRKISDIAATVGFSDDSYFSKVFKTNFNCTPHQFRSK
ncbi:MAG: helix-turn-helix domain-containing protein [Fibrobacteres bacterium]|nr:helix-turn-helix domain-containing protein [Fibrobacterota bacterium]